MSLDLNRKEDKVKNKQKPEKPLGGYYAKYIGGHSKFPKSKDTDVWIYSDKIAIAPFNLVIPYSSITNIENLDYSKILTIIYNDGKEQETLVLNFGANTKYVHPILYGKFKENRSLI